MSCACWGCFVPIACTWWGGRHAISRVRCGGSGDENLSHALPMRMAETSCSSLMGSSCSQRCYQLVSPWGSGKLHLCLCGLPPYIMISIQCFILHHQVTFVTSSNCGHFHPSHCLPLWQPHSKIYTTVRKRLNCLSVRPAVRDPCRNVPSSWLC